MPVDFFQFLSIKLNKYANFANYMYYVKTRMSVFRVIPQSSLFLDSGSLKLRTPPTAMMAAVINIGMALLTPINWPNATFPRMAAIRPMNERNPNPEDLQKILKF